MNHLISYENYCKEWLIDVYFNDPPTVELGRRFALKIASQWLDINPDNYDNDLVYCDGTGDGGIDIAFLDRGESDDDASEEDSIGHTWYLIQSKLGKSFSGKTTIIQDGQKVIDTLSGSAKKLSSLTEDLLERLNIFINKKSDQDKIILVFATVDDLDEDEKRALNDIKIIGRERIGNFFDVQSVSIRTIYARLEDKLNNDNNLIKIDITAKVTPSGKNLLVGSIGLVELYKFLEEYRKQTNDLDRIFEKNVRKFLGKRGKVNKKMRDTLINLPQRFGLYNNGITIVASDFTFDEEKSLVTELVEPFIVNGCQTSRTIWEVLYQREESGGTGKSKDIDSWRQKIKEGVVIVKIVKVGSEDEESLRLITRYTNSQNAVREKDFITLEDNFHTWKTIFSDDYNIFLEVQRGGWESEKAKQNKNLDGKKLQCSANAFELLKVYGAGWLNKVGLALNKNAPFAPDGTVFKEIIKTDGFGAKDLYASYLLQNAAAKEKFGRGATVSQRKQTKFLFYWVVTYILNDTLNRMNFQQSAKNLTESIIALSMPRNEEGWNILIQTAAEVIDGYLLDNTDFSVFNENVFKTKYENNLHAFLRSDDLASIDCQQLRNELSISLRSMARGNPSPRDIIINIIKDGITLD